MSDRVVIRCPGCNQKLGLKPELLGSHIKCPRCSVVLATRSPAEKRSSVDSAAKRQKNSDISRSSSAASPERRRSSSRSQKSGKPKPPRKSPQLDPFEEDLDDLLLEGEDDANWLDEVYDDDYGNELELPGARPAKKKKKKSAALQSQSKKKKKKNRRSAAPGNPLAWVGSGLVAGAISIALTVAIGMTGIGLLLIIAAFLSAGLIGGAIRSTAGSTDGWGSGLTAAAILLPAIFLGRMGAFYLNPALTGLGSGADFESSEQQIERHSTDEAMIAGIIEDGVADDHQWLNANGINEDSLYSDAYWDSDEEWLLPFEDQYHPTV